jgi:hypothetical protein
MKIKLFCLILVLFMSLAALPGTVFANMAVNESFELDADNDDYPDNWSEWSCYFSGWCGGGWFSGDGTTTYREAEGIARSGDDCMDAVGTEYAFSYQDHGESATGDMQGSTIPVVIGQEYYLSAYFKDTGGGTGGIYLTLEYRDGPRASAGEAFYKEYYYEEIPDDGKWHYVEMSYVTPATSELITICMGAPGGGTYLYDDVWFGTTPPSFGASDPVPPDGGSAMAGLDKLRWTKPATNCPGTHPVTSDIYFDPNEFLVDTMHPMAKLNVTPQEPNWIALDPGDVVAEEDYYWRVVSFDPNCGHGAGGENPVVLEGSVWHFTTVNLAPVVEAGLNQSAWLSGGSASVDLSGVITDDGLPNPPESVSYTWSKISGPALASNSNPSGTVPEDGIVPTTVGFNTAGTYVLKLEGDDDGKTSSDTVKVFVYDAAPSTMLVAHWPFDVATQFNDTADSHHGTPQDNAQIDPCDFRIGDGSLLVDGDGDYVDCGGGTTDPNLTTWASPQDPNRMSITCWMKSDNFGGQWANLVSKGTLAWRLQRNADSDNVEFSVAGIGAIGSGDSPVIDKVDDGEWHHIAGVVMEDAIYLYVDGIPAGITEGGPVGHGGHDLWIGKGYNADYLVPHEYSGNIDDVRFYECPLNAAKVLAEYIAGGGSNSCGGEYVPADFNQDCFVTLDDFAIMFADWWYCNDVANPDLCE